MGAAISFRKQTLCVFKSWQCWCLLWLAQIMNAPDEVAKMPLQLFFLLNKR